MNVIGQMAMQAALQDEIKRLRSEPVEQGSEAWIQQRLGKATASRIADIIATTKSGYSTSRANYAAELITERLTDTPASDYKNAAMQWGTENEPLARRAYEFFRERTVEQVGFIDHPTIEMSGASPDGLIGADGLVEIKCPYKTAIHINTLLSEKIPSEYITQMQWQMCVTGRQWCDFVSFDPRMPDTMKLFTKREPRDNMVIDRLEKEVKLFLKEVDETIRKLQNAYG